MSEDRGVVTGCGAARRVGRWLSCSGRQAAPASSSLIVTVRDSGMSVPEVDSDAHPFADAQPGVSDDVSQSDGGRAGDAAAEDAYSTPMSRSGAIAEELKVMIRNAAKPTALEDLRDALPTFSTFHQVIQAGDLADDERVHFILNVLIPDHTARLARGREGMAIRELLRWRDGDGDPQNLTTRRHKGAAHVHVAYETFERRWERKLLDECAGAFCGFDVEDRMRGAKPQESDGAAELSPTDSLVGLVSVYRRLDERKVADAMLTARTISILNTYIPELIHYDRALPQALRNGAQVQILLLHYESSAAALRSASIVEGVDAVYEENRIRMGVRHNLAILAAIARTLDDDACRRLRVALYDSLPSLAIYRLDDDALVSVFLHGQLAIDAPQMRVRGRDTLLGGKVFAELETVWSIADEVEDLRGWNGVDGGDRT